MKRLHNNCFPWYHTLVNVLSTRNITDPHKQLSVKSHPNE